MRTALFAVLFAPIVLAQSTLRESDCKPLTAAQKQWQPKEWAPFEKYTLACGVRGVIYVLTVSAPLYYRDHKEMVSLPAALVVSADGSVVGSLPQAFPDDPPSTLQVRFLDWRNKWPHRIHLFIADEAAGGNRTPPALVWNIKSRRYENAAK